MVSFKGLLTVFKIFVKDI